MFEWRRERRGWWWKKAEDTGCGKAQREAGYEEFGGNGTVAGKETAKDFLCHPRESGL